MRLITYPPNTQNAVRRSGNSLLVNLKYFFFNLEFSNEKYIFAKTVKNMSREIEEWRPIQGYEGLYEVSDCGRVKSVDRIITRKNGRKLPFKEKILKGGKNNMGYLLVCLNKDGKETWKLVHRLVAEAFIPNPHNFPQVNHIDENKLNNTVFVNDDGSIDIKKSNLEWCTAPYNTNYGSRNERLKTAKAKTVYQYTLDGKLVAVYISAKEAARQTRFSQADISRVCNGGYFDKKKKKWINMKQHKGYKWSYTPL